MIRSNTKNLRKNLNITFFCKIAVFGLVALILMAACSKNKSTNPLENATDYDLLYAELFNSDDIEGVEVFTSDSVQTSIALDIDVRDSVGFALDGEDNFIIAPESTVTDSVELTINCRRLLFVQGSDSSRSALAFECTPEGQVFTESLIFDIYPGYFTNNPHSNAVKLYLYNPAEKKWNVVSTKQKTDPRLRYNIGHFSKYAISD